MNLVFSMFSFCPDQDPKMPILVLIQLGFSFIRINGNHLNMHRNIALMVTIGWVRVGIYYV